jgi:formylglycine-generating enzyme required for sulfatase activity
MKAGRCYRLPTEAEWEFACRAGTTTAYHHGPELTKEMATFGRPHEQGPEAVATHPPNAFGLFDMHGGVWEWCSDWFDEHYYNNCPRVAPPGPDTGRVRVIRGGSWMSDRDFCRAACREYAGPDSHRPRDGFRIVLVLA